MSAVRRLKQPPNSTAIPERSVNDLYKGKFPSLVDDRNGRPIHVSQLQLEGTP
jgi:hypothetical protein